MPGGRFFVQILDIVDRAITPLTQRFRLGHVLWGVAIGVVASGGDRVFSALCFTAGMSGMIHGYIKDFVEAQSEHR